MNDLDLGMTEYPQHLIRQGLGFASGGHAHIGPPVFVPLSHRNDPESSHSAAVSMQIVASHHRIGCLTALALYGPMTAHEVAAKCGFDHWSVAARRLTELHEQGTIERIKTDMPGVYQTRKTPSGRQACVWRIVRA
jgi:hypothetical protein